MNEKPNPKDPMAGLLRRALRPGASASPPAANSACPGPEILAAYYERSLEAPEVARWELHFSECASCRQQLALLAVAEGNATPVSGERRAGAAWIWNWRWLAPLGAAAAALALWVAIRPAPPRSEVPPSLTEQQITRSVPQTPPQEPESRVVPSARGEGKAVPSRREADRPAKVQTGAVAEGTPASPKGANKVSPLHTRPSEPAAPALAQEKKAEADERPAKAAREARRDEAFLVADASRQQEQKQAVIVGQAPEAARKVEQAESPSPADQRARAPVSANESVAGRVSAKSTAALYLREVGSEEVVVVSAEPRIRWRLLPDGGVARSEDSAQTWQVQSTPVKVRLVAGSAPSAKVCWLVGPAGTVLRTTDGQKWEKTLAPAEADLVSVVARDALRAKVTAADGRVYLTQDGGRTWKLQE